MVTRRINLPEHDLTLRLVGGEHTSTDAIEFFRSLDSTCATRWLSYFDPTADLSRINVASVPEMKHVIAQKQQELFGDQPKPYAIVCESEASRQYFFQFWQRYYPESEVSAENMRIFRHLEEAYDWLELSGAARAAVARAIRDWEMARAIDAWDVADGYPEGFEGATPHEVIGQRPASPLGALPIRARWTGASGAYSWRAP